MVCAVSAGSSASIAAGAMVRSGSSPRPLTFAVPGPAAVALVDDLAAELAPDQIHPGEPLLADGGVRVRDVERVALVRRAGSGRESGGGGAGLRVVRDGGRRPVPGGLARHRSE